MTECQRLPTPALPWAGSVFCKSFSSSVSISDFCNMKQVRLNNLSHVTVISGALWYTEQSLSLTSYHYYCLFVSNMARSLCRAAVRTYRHMSSSYPFTDERAPGSPIGQVFSHRG